MARERREKPLTAAEKQRRYRERRDADQERRKEYLLKERLAWKRKVDTKKWKPVSELSSREQRYRRMKNREAQNRFRQRQADKLPTELSEATSTADCDVGMSRKRSAGRKKVCARRSKVYRQLQKLEERMEDEHRAANRYWKRYERLLKKVKPAEPDTPRTKTRKLLRNFGVSGNVHRTLVFHHAVIDNLRACYADCKGLAEKRKWRNLLMGRIVRKCKLQQYCRKVFGFSQRRFEPSVPVVAKSRGIQSRTIMYLKRALLDYYQRDDVSRATAGKKETITRGKTKRQKRFVLDSLINLHRKFLAENPNHVISYSLFCRMRPFWVLIPDVKSRETCLCKQHANLEFMANKLLKLHILQTSNLEYLADACSCSPKSKSCMYGACNICKHKTGLPVS